MSEPYPPGPTDRMGEPRVPLVPRPRKRPGAAATGAEAWMRHVTHDSTIRNLISRRGISRQEVHWCGGFMGRCQSFLVGPSVLKVYCNDPLAAQQREILGLSIYRSAPVLTPVIEEHGVLKSGHPWILMSRLPGTTLAELARSDALEDAGDAAVVGELGGVLSILHGWTLQSLPRRWPYRQRQRVLEQSFDLKLYGLPQRLILEARSCLRRAEREPVFSSFLHRDYSSRNVILTAGAEGPGRLGVIDFEKSMWGDPLEDLATVALHHFADTRWRDSFMSGYDCRLGAHARARYRLYCLQLTLRGLVWSEQLDRDFHSRLTEFGSRILDCDPALELC